MCTMTTSDIHQIFFSIIVYVVYTCIFITSTCLPLKVKDPVFQTSFFDLVEPQQENFAQGRIKIKWCPGHHDKIQKFS